jgi:hypothetical protein
MNTNTNTNSQNILLSTAYLPSISYLKALVNSEILRIEQFENYIKQSYRNRCKIYAANGVMSLSIPVILATNKKILIKDVKIDYNVAWQKQHFKSIESAYRTSPFYDYLIDDFIPFYSKEYKFLLDFNLGLLNVILDIIQVDKQILLTEDYLHSPKETNDLRNFFSPKKENPGINELKPYPQVFDHKFGFQPDLSCIDLIFNLGSDAYDYLIGK